MYPLKMSPCVKETVWGGNNLKQKFNKEYDFEKAGESWEISAHPSGLSTIVNGSFSGLTFKEVIKANPDFCGDTADNFPLMFKIIDANDDLSIQVHPDDSYAKINENGSFGKTEMWYVVDCKPGSKFGIGFNRDMTDDDIKSAIKDGTLDSYINYVEVKKGDLFFIPAGTVHCICSGVVVAELQESSDITYRLYDYNRKDKNGKLRELHIDKALAVLDKKAETASSLDEIKCEYFTCTPVKCEERSEDCVMEKYHILFFAEGSGKIVYGDKSEVFDAGDTYVLPKNMGEYEILGSCVYLKCTE